jgi:hypothetical protein
LFERFAERAWQVVVLAQDEARAPPRASSYTSMPITRRSATRSSACSRERAAAPRLPARKIPTSRTLREDDVTVGGISPPALRDYTEVEYPTLERASSTSVPLALGGLLFAVALAVGLLIGWLIWG